MTLIVVGSYGTAEIDADVLPQYIVWDAKPFRLDDECGDEPNTYSQVPITIVPKDAVR